jgi:chemotaxis protein MotB
MGKKKKHEEHENLERWLVSYADFITLLFATFTALYALSVADLAKMKDVAQSIRDGFQSQSLISGINSIIQGKSAPSANTNPMSKETGEGEGLLGKHDSLTMTKGDTKKTKNAVKNLKKTVTAVNAAIQGLKGKSGGGGNDPSLKTPGVELSVQERGIRISFDSSLLFDPGSASLKKEAMVALGGLAPELYDMSKTNFIHIEGHTDNTPISTGTYPSNWELSSARASSVVRFLIGKHNFDATHMAAVGYADTRALTTNTTPQGRAKNRRIDIILYSYEAGRNVDVRGQYFNEETLVKSEDGEGKYSAPTPVQSHVIEAKDSQGVATPINHDKTDPTQPPRIQPIKPINPISGHKREAFDPLKSSSGKPSSGKPSSGKPAEEQHAASSKSGTTHEPVTQSSSSTNKPSASNTSSVKPQTPTGNVSVKPAAGKAKAKLIQARDEE